MKKASLLLFVGAVMMVAGPSYASTIGYADVILDYYDSGAGPMPGPYGGTMNVITGVGTLPVPVSLDVVLGPDPGRVIDFMSLPTGSYIDVGFVDETVIDGPGNDIFIRETGASGERADVYVRNGHGSWVFLGQAYDRGVTSFDLASIGFTSPVMSLRIVGLDNGGPSPGFDVVSIQVMPGSIGPVPEPTSLVLLGVGVAGALLRFRRKSA